MYWTQSPASVGSKPVPPPSRQLSGVLNALMDPSESSSLPAVVMSSVWSARAAAMREAATEELDLLQRQLENEIQNERSKLATKN